MRWNVAKQASKYSPMLHLKHCFLTFSAQTALTLCRDKVNQWSVRCVLISSGALMSKCLGRPTDGWWWRRLGRSVCHHRQSFRDIFSGNVLWQSEHRNILGCERTTRRQYLLHYLQSFSLSHVYQNDSLRTATHSVLCRDDRWWTCHVFSQRCHKRSSTQWQWILQCGWVLHLDTCW